MDIKATDSQKIVDEIDKALFHASMAKSLLQSISLDSAEDITQAGRLVHDIGLVQQSLKGQIQMEITSWQKKQGNRSISDSKQNIEGHVSE